MTFRGCRLHVMPLLLAALAAAVSPGVSTERAPDTTATAENADSPPAAVLGLRPGQSPADLDDESLQYLLGLHHTEEENVRMVLLPVTVTGRKGRPVRDLLERDFRLFEDRIPQEIEFFSSDTASSIAIAFLLDVSGSMQNYGKLEAAKEAIRYFVETLRPSDRFALICFADEQVAWVTEFTTDRERFLMRLSVQDGFGKTAINDAVAATPGLVDEKIKGKKAIVMITDGVDTASTISPWQAVRTARRVDVPIYAVGFSSVPRSAVLKGSTPGNLRVLQTFTRETGGLLFSVNDPDELKEAASTIAEELRFQYLIGYYPSRNRWDGRFRRVRLEGARDRWDVRTRNGYYAVP